MEYKTHIGYVKSLKETLLRINEGESVILRNSDFKVSSVRVATSNLKKKYGFSFSVSDAGRLDDFKVTRLRNEYK
jgi:hypothetical protein